MIYYIFRAMFTTNMQEAKAKEVELKQVDPDVFNCVLKFLYTGRIKIEKECNSSICDMIKAILGMADLFHLPDLKIQCEKHLLGLIDISSCLTIHYFSDLHSLPLLKTTSLEFMLEHFVDVSRSEDFCQLDIQQLVNYINSDRLNALNEDPVYNAMIYWLMHDWEKRKCLVSKALGCVRFPLCSAQFFLDVIEQDNIMSEPGCDTYLREYKEYHLVPEKREEMSVNIRAQPRISQTQQRLIVMGGRDSDWKTMQKGWYLNQSRMQWEELCDIPFDNFLFSMCCLNNRAYISGGYRIPHGTTTDLWEYSGYSLRWTKKADMNVAREDHGSVACVSCVYVIGGTSATERVLADVEKYDPEINEWQSLPPLLTAVFQPAAAAVASKIYVIGGTKYATHELRYTTNMGMQVLDTCTAQWSHLASSMFRISGGCAAVLSNRIYVSCGYDRLLCSYDTVSSKWEYHSVSPVGHSRGRAVLHNGKILLIGGKYKTKDARYDWTNSIDVYDPVMKSWSLIEPPCPRPATDFGAVLLSIAV